MKNGCIFVLVALAFAGCEQEPIYRGSNIDRQFGELNKQGWQVAGMNPQQRAAANNPNVRVIREADFSSLQFRTNFQVDDPRYPELINKDDPKAASSGPPATPQPGANPWGPTPIAPGR